MKGHDQYVDLLNALSEYGKNEALVSVLEETVIFDVTGADRKTWPDAAEQRVALMKRAGKEGLTTLDFPKWAMVCVDNFIVHLERMEDDGKHGCKARLIVLDEDTFCYCPAAAFIPDDWDGAGLLEWEKTDRVLDHDKNMEDVALIMLSVWQGATQLWNMPEDYRVNKAGRMIGKGQPVEGAVS